MPRSEEDHKNLIEQGFTLVELLIVIVILGILAGIVVFAVGNLTQNADKNSCKTEGDTFATAVQAYKAEQSPGGALAGGGTAANFTADLALLKGAKLLNSDPKYGSGVAAAGKWQYKADFSVDTSSGATGCP